RITRGRAPGTGISREHSSGTPSRPSLRAATAGNSASRSSVAVKMHETMSSAVRSFRAMTSRTSSSVAPRIDSGSLRSTLVAPRMANSRMAAREAIQWRWSVELPRVAGLDERLFVLGMAPLDPPAPFELRVELGSQENGDVGDPEPHEEDHDAGQRAVGLVVGPEVGHEQGESR